jgi:hypothetical protein
MRVSASVKASAVPSRSENSGDSGQVASCVMRAHSTPALRALLVRVCTQ